MDSFRPSSNCPHQKVSVRTNFGVITKAAKLLFILRHYQIPLFHIQELLPLGLLIVIGDVLCLKFSDKEVP